MKTLHIVMTLMCVASFAVAQPREGMNKELSLSGSYQDYSSGSSQSRSAFLLSPRVGFYVGENFEIEPEGILLLAEGSEPTYLLNGNLCYNITTTSKARPFVLAGYGIANTTPFFNVPLFHADFGISVLNLGGGLKYYFKEDVAFRLEYRYQKFTGESTTTSLYGYTYTQKVDMKYHSVQFGFSLLL